MNLSTTPHLPRLEDRFFLWLVVAVSLAFGWILWPFFSAVLWGTILAILFAPLYRRLLKSMAQRRSLAAVATDLNGRLKQCCKSADSPSGAALEMRRHLTLFARYGLPNPKATQLVRDLTMKAFTAHKR